MPADSEKKSEKRFGEIGQELGLLSAQQVGDALQRQKSLRGSTTKSRIGEVLIMMNVLTVEQVKKILSEQRKRRQAEADAVLPVERFGDYKLLAKLGEGGMGAVYKAQEVLANRVVALKVLRKNLAGNKAFVERFEREAKMAGSLNHPNIVTCHVAGMVHGIQFLSMEFVDGETLSARLRGSGGKLSEKEALPIIRDVARGLAQAHKAGIVHRDIKPDNILLGKDGSVKLSDFGTAKSFLDEDSLSRTGQVIGTPNYISPEQVRADKDIDHRADLYSLGGTLYHILTGRLPFNAISALQTMRAHLEDELENPHDVNPDLTDGAVQIVVKLMAKSPHHRYQSAQELVDDIDAVIVGAAPKHASIQENESSIRPARRRRKKKAQAAGCMSMVVLAVAIGGGLFLSYANIT